MSEINVLTEQQKMFYASFSFGGSEGDITPSDTAENKWIGLYVGVGGDVEIVKANGQTQVYKNVPDGGFLPVAVSKVKAGLTTATNIIGQSAWDEDILANYK